MFQDYIHEVPHMQTREGRYLEVELEVKRGSKEKKGKTPILSSIAFQEGKI